MTLPVVFTANGPSGYNLTNSLRFRSSASAYLNRTPASASNRRTYTWSAWVKRSELSSNQSLFAVNATGDYQEFRFTASNTLQLILDASALNYAVEVPTVVWRDVSAWYHIVLAVDTTQATSTNRVKIYVNGIQQTVSAVSGFSFPAQNFDTYVNATLPHAIGNFNYLNSAYFNGYMTEINLIDGQALTPSSFGETSTTTGVWIPKKYTGTYGTNGFYLPFTDTTSTSTLGTDFSGNSNTWTVNNISLTAGSTYDSMNDVPTLTSATTANYAVFNPLDKDSDITTSNGNLAASTSTVAHNLIRSTIAIPSSGKFYAEMRFDQTMTGSPAAAFALISPSASLNAHIVSAGNYSVYGSSSTSLNSGATSGATITSMTSGQIWQFAVDADNNQAWVGLNNAWYNVYTSGATTGNPSAGTNPTFTGTMAGLFLGADFVNSSGSINFGQQPFAYTPPTGFVALNTFNLPTPTIGATASSQANKYMNISLYTGTGSSQSITGLGFQPDWTWIKSRSGATNHGLYDAVRGVQKQLESNTTTSETTETTGLTAFGSDGFTVGALAQLNTSSATYVGWNWKANGTGVTNTAGSITSTVSANTTAGFSIVTWTGSGSTATIGHGLGVAPSMIIWIHRTNASAYNHITYHASLPSAAYVVYLNLTIAQSSDNNAFNSTAPTSSVFTVGGYNSADTMVAYCFAPIAGYSAFGSYTGNGSSDGPFIFTGFRPRFIMIKRTDATQNWIIVDTSRDTYNVMNKRLFPNLSNAEDTGIPNFVDALSNGFKCRDSNVSYNASGGTYIYMAFAESPFKYANAR